MPKGNFNGATFDDSPNDNDLSCDVPYCPTTSTGKYGYGREFGSATGQKRYLYRPISPSPAATSSLTVEAWINPTDNPAPYQRIAELGNATAGYDLEINPSADSRKARFNVWNGAQTGVDTNSNIPTNTWTHLVGTYVRNGNSNILKIYVNGVLENTIIVNNATPIMAVAAGEFTLGISSIVDKNNPFYGSMDEVKIYNEALSAMDVQNNYQGGDDWFCAATTTPVVSVTPGSCGDNVIDTGEVCDQGTVNNGHVCTPAYGVSCSYCSADCQNTIDVQPSQYCGDGVIQSPEKCEVFGENIFSSASTTNRTLYIASTTRTVIRSGHARTNLHHFRTQ